MVVEGYQKLNYPTPHDLKNQHTNSDILIIGSGSSTKQLIPYKDKIRGRFDAIIGINLTLLEFEDQMDYHFIIEKNPNKIYGPMISGGRKYRTDLPRVLNWKSIEHFPKDIPIYKATRIKFEEGVDIRLYRHDDKEGLLIGPPDARGLSTGTASMQALHLACIMGAKNIYLVGTDLVFKDKYDHFYPDNLYRKSQTKAANRSPIIKVPYKGKMHETTEFFASSAKFFDSVIENRCKPVGITVYDFSDGLITKANKIDIHEFFKENT